jgi:FHA domain
MKKVPSFVSELFRRKVVRLVGAYVAIFWLLAQGAAALGPVVGLPTWSIRAFIIVGIALIPVLAVLSWRYDIVPPQIVRDPKDVESMNPALSWAMRRHDNSQAGHVLLKWSSDGQTTKEKRFFKPVSIGREPNNDIELSDERVSRHHAVLWAEDGGWRVRDLDSANGTFIDQMRVTNTATLPLSCELRFHPNGPTVSVFIAKAAETLVSS